MPSWISSLLFAALVATVPLSWVLRVLLDLPDPLILSHRRWPPWANFLLIGVISAVVTVFVHGIYYDHFNEPLEVGTQFLITGLVYVFGFTLLLRQFSGLYPEFFVTTGRTGLAMRKTVYRHIANVEKVNEVNGQMTLDVELENGDRLLLELPSHHLSVFYDQVESCRSLE